MTTAEAERRMRRVLVLWLRGRFRENAARAERLRLELVRLIDGPAR